MNATILQNAINQYKAEKETRKKSIEQEVTRDILMPYFAEIDASLSNALKEVQANADKEKAELAQTAEKTKTEYRAKTIAIKNVEIDGEYDPIISNLEKLLEKVKEQ